MDFRKHVMANYVQLIYTLFDHFEQAKLHPQGAKRGKPYTYKQKQAVVFFTIMQFRRIFAFKAQNRWLKSHQEM